MFSENSDVRLMTYQLAQSPGKPGPNEKLVLPCVVLTKHFL